MTIFTIFVAWLQILNLPASLQNKNTRVGPFPWKWSVLQNPDRERTNQSPGNCLRLSLPYNKYILLTKREGRTGRISALGLFCTDLVQKRPRADILPVRSRASLVNKRFIIRLKKALKVFAQIPCNVMRIKRSRF